MCKACCRSMEWMLGLYQDLVAMHGKDRKIPTDYGPKTLSLEP